MKRIAFVTKTDTFSIEYRNVDELSYTVSLSNGRTYQLESLVYKETSKLVYFDQMLDLNSINLQAIWDATSSPKSQTVIKDTPTEKPSVFFTPF